LVKYTKMNLEKTNHLHTLQVDAKEKFEWLKIWNSNNKTKHNARFLMNIIGIDWFDAWMTCKTLWWHAFNPHNYSLKLTIVSS